MLIRYAKRMVKSLLGRLGYEVRRDPRWSDSIDYATARTVKESQYYTVWSAPCPLFAPWIGHPDFRALYDDTVASHTVVSPDRCYLLASLARYAVHLSGDFAECGVFRGGTALLLARTMKDSGKTLYLFDSFQGLPKANATLDPYFREGDFSGVSTEFVENLLKDFREIIDIRPGWIPETFRELADRRFAFVHIDVDLYQSALDCCGYFYSRLVPGGVLVFDEYAFAATRGEKDAVDEFFADKPESPITLPTGQAIVLKVPGAPVSDRSLLPPPTGLRAAD